MRRALALSLAGLAAAGAVGACSGGGSAGARDPKAARTAPGAPRKAHDGGLGFGAAPPARLFAATRQGSDMALGAVVSWCLRDRCERRSVRPTRTVATLPGEFMMFILEKAPAAARTEVKLPGPGSAIVEPLRPSTSMASRAPSEPGRYLVSLVAEWEGAQARWVFAVSVAESE